MSLSASVETAGSIFETPQQFLAGEIVSPDVEYKLGRACTAHCFSLVKAELDDTADRSTETLVDFVLTNGANTKSGLYSDGVGWNIIGLADMLREDSYRVIAQNMYYSREERDLQQAYSIGRARTEFEKARLNLYGSSGGLDRSRWLEPMYNTLLFGGLVVSSIQIPLLSGDGYGKHAVVITEIDEEEGKITYFDPDFYNQQRYSMGSVSIERHTEPELIYKRLIEEHLNVMTGEVVHIFGPKA